MKINRVLLMLCLLPLMVLLGCTERAIDSDSTWYRPPQITNTTWEQISDPESVGWSLEKLNNAYQYSKTIQTAAVMIVYQGKVLYYWGEIDKKFWTRSTRKSLMSAVYGIYVENGTIDLNRTMAQLGIDDANPSLSDQEKQATVRMLLQARSGVYHEAAAEATSMKASRPARGSHLPGTFWYYNNWDFNTLSTIFTQVTGKDFFKELDAKILAPIGCEDFQVSDGIYSYEPVSIHPAYPFRITARDMARFGLLCLRKGAWNGQRIISESWIRESTTSYSDLGDAGGYGYMWWIVDHGKSTFSPAQLPDGSYSAQGAYGQYCVVIPAYDLVIVHRVNSDIQNNVSGSQFGILLNLILDARPR